MKRKYFAILLTLVLTPSLLLPMFGSTTLSSPQTRIYVDPPSIAATVGGNFTIDINVEDVTNLCAYEINLTWDPQILDAIGIMEGDFLKTSGGTFFEHGIDQSGGWLHVYSYLLPSGRVPEVSGSGTLANVTFHGVNLGGCALVLYDIMLVGNANSVTPPPYLGDATGDLYVDIFDAMTVAHAYGGKLGDPRYNPNADFNGDNIVDFLDVMYVHCNMGHNFQLGDLAVEPQKITHEVSGGYARVRAVPIPIGVILPDGSPPGDGIWEAAQMARDKINAEGGILGHDVELIPINEHAVPEPDPEAGIAEMLTALDAGAQFLVGGYSPECVGPMREAAMDYAADYGRPIWFIAGAATDALVDCGGGLLACGSCVRCDYGRYKYVFRSTPMNSTILGEQIFTFLRFQVLPILSRVYESPIKTYIIAEDQTCYEKMVRVLAGSTWYPEIEPGVPNPYPSPPNVKAVLGDTAVVVGVERPSAAAANFSGELSRVEEDEARLIVHIFSEVAGAQFIKQWGELQVPAVCVGINVESQMQEFYASVEGGCEYESFLGAVGTKTPIVPNVTDVFWEDYEARWGHAPIYTAWGAYEAIMGLDVTIEEAGRWPMTSDELIPLLEQTDRLTMIGQFKYTGPNGIYHDVFSNELGPTWTENFTRPFMVQWQAGRLEVIWPGKQPYSKKYALPRWMYPYNDVNYDGNVDIFDIVTLAGAFDSRPWDDPWSALENEWERWDIRADVVKDNRIDTFDIQSVGNDFGTTVTLPLPYPS